MTEDDKDFRAENNSNLNQALGTYDDFRQKICDNGVSKNQTTNDRIYFRPKSTTGNTSDIKK